MAAQRYNYYTTHAEEQRRLLSRRSKRTPLFITGEVTSFIVFIALIGISTITLSKVLPFVLAAFALCAYVLIRIADNRNGQAIHKAKAMLKVYEGELAYLAGHFESFDTGDRYADPHHPFSFDLDIFGPGSFFNRICRTSTTGGSDVLASELSSTANRSSRYDLIAELASSTDFRTAFQAVGIDAKVDTNLTSVVTRVAQVQCPNFILGLPFRVIAYISVTGFLLSVLSGALGLCAAGIPISWGLIQFFTAWGLTSRPLRQLSNSVDNLYHSLTSLSQLVDLIIQSSGVTTPEGKALLERLNDAPEAFRQLSRILQKMDSRGNILGLFITDSLFFRDIFLLADYIHWRDRYLKHLQSWADTVGIMDALVSMATFSYNEPSATRPEVIESGEIVFEAQSLWHPFLGEKAVSNNFSIADRNFYIITGANMAGKSTFLRTIGINYIMALCGLPVMAKHLRVSCFGLFTSMRTTDDLTHGISYFNAELLRLQQLLDYCKHQHRTLIILDEILKGTNSLDKLNGSRLFLQHVEQMPVTGVVATHDLELSKMSNEHIHNYCFEISLGTDVTYTYKISPGVARNQNATFLLRKMLSGGITASDTPIPGGNATP